MTLGAGIPRGAIVVTMLAGCTSTVTGTGTSGATESSGAPGTAGTPSACESIAGSWDVRGSCGLDSCEITQAGCDLALACSLGRELSGVIDGRQFTYSGRSLGGVSTRCTGTLGLAGLRADGFCNPATGVACSFSAIKE